MMNLAHCNQYDWYKQRKTDRYRENVVRDKSVINVEINTLCEILPTYYNNVPHKVLQYDP